MSKRAQIFLLNSIFVAGGLIAVSIYIGSTMSAQMVGKTVSRQEVPVRKENYRLGSGNKITLVEFSDFQCPACRSVAPDVARIAEDFDDKITLIFKHLPIRQHANAKAAAEAAEAAGAQGQFWKMHDLLFQNQSRWAPSPRPTIYFVKYARQLELNAAQFQRDLAAKAFRKKIDRDIADAHRLQVNSTPTIYINGHPMQATPNYANLKKAIELELQALSISGKSQKRL